jgi:integrase
MLKEFDVLIERFSSGLTTGKYNNYVKVLQNSLIPHLEHYCIKEGIAAEELFKKMISASHIIDAGVEYIQRPKVTGEAAVDKYLTAANEFFKAVIFPEWPSCPLSVVGNFQEYRDNILNRSSKSLKSYEPRQHLDDEGYENLVKYLKNLGDDSLRNKMAKAVIPLILLYGFKLGTIAEMKRDCFDEQRRTIEIQVEKENIRLELPYQIYINVQKIYDEKIDKDLLFAMAENQRPISDHFDTIIKNFNKIQGTGKKITLDGLAKYAVINMFYIGMDPIVIRQVTGMKDVILKYCQQEAWKKRKESLKNYVNSQFRCIKVYDNFNE